MGVEPNDFQSPVWFLIGGVSNAVYLDISEDETDFRLDQQPVNARKVVNLLVFNN